MQGIDRKTAILHGGDISLHGLANGVRALHEISHELGALAEVHTQHVVQHQDLPGSALARANADGGALGELIGKFFGEGEFCLYKVREVFGFSLFLEFAEYYINKE